MDFGPYIVYVKVDNENRITAVNSSAFLHDITDWVEIDRGYGDIFHHAQGNYFPQPIRDDNGICRYRFEEMEDGAPGWRESTPEELAADLAALPAPETAQTPEERLSALEQENAYLKETLEIILSGETGEVAADG